MSRQWKRTVATVSVLFLATTQSAGARVWTDVTGIYHAEAEFVELTGANARLRKPDGRNVTVPLAKLGRWDRLLAEYLGRQGAWGEDLQQVFLPDREDDDVVVVVHGSGVTADEALRDAVQNAVHVASGTLVRGETKITGRAIAEQTLLLSGGFVARYEIVAERHSDHWVERTILAMIRRGGPSGQSAVTAGIMSSDAAQLYSEALSKMSCRRNGKAMLDRLLEQLPADLVQIELASPPRLARVGDDRVTLASELCVGINESRYSRWQQEAIEILEQLATRSGTLKGVRGPVPARLKPWVDSLLKTHFLSENSTGSQFEGWVAPQFERMEVFHRTRFGGPPIDALRNYVLEEPTTLVVVNVDDDRSGSSSCWKWFEIGVPLIVPTQRLTAIVAYGDDDVPPARCERLRIGPGLPGISVSQDGGCPSKIRTIILSPFFVHHAGDGYNVRDVKFVRGFSIQEKTTLTLEELSRVKRVSVSVASE